MKYFFFFILSFFTLVSFASNQPADPARYQYLTNQLRCLVCQNEDLSDSTAPLAIDLKLQIRRMIAEGKSNEEILNYLTKRYGEFILFKPTVTPKNYLLWFGPFALLLLALIILAFIIYTHRRRATQNITLNTEEKEKLQELLK